MLTPTFRLSDTQIADLATICEIGASRLEMIASSLARQKPTIRRSRIESILREELGAGESGYSHPPIVANRRNISARSFVSERYFGIHHTRR